MLDYYYYRFLEKRYKKKRIIRFVNTSKGVKGLNAYLLNSQPQIIEDNIYIDTETLFLGIDFLTDKYTLLQRPLLSSPHIDFVKRLNDSVPIEDSDYLNRLYNGTLDWRYPMKRARDTTFFKSRFDHCKELIEDEAYKPVMVYCVSEKYYIYDGKHRAAVCGMLGRNRVKCMLISPTIEVTGLRGYMLSGMTSTRFEKHLLIKNMIEKEYLY